MQPVVLDKRLACVADFTPECAVCADIGADHGHLSAYLLKTGRVEKMYISDISAPSLNKARMLFQGDELERRAMFRVGDGLQNVEEKLNACVISGMGGETIMGILERGFDKISDATLILQPNVDAEPLRAFLYDHGFAIADEELIFDVKWWYMIIKAVPDAHAARPDFAEMLAGPVLLKKHHPLLPEFARRQVRIITKACKNLDAADPRAQEMSRKLEVWEGIAKWQQ